LLVKSLTVYDIATLVNGEVLGDGSIKINRISPLDTATSQDISFLSNRKFEKQLNTTKAGCVLLSKYDKNNLLTTTAILCDDPYLAFALTAQALDSTPIQLCEISKKSSIHHSVQLGNEAKIAAGVVINEGCVIGDNVSIGANVSIGNDCVIGSNTKLFANVSIYHQTMIGDDCIFHSGAVIGSDGFGYANDSGQWIKIPQTGKVVIGNKVEVGANSTIDRGALNNTIIEDGVKIDNLCHIAHNVEIGQNTAMAAMSGIAGSTKIGSSCTLSGCTAIIGHLTIAAGTHFTVGTIVSKSNDKAGVFSSGTGAAQDNKSWRKSAARFKQLDGMAKKIRDLEKMIKSLKSGSDNE
jgi:UDP-3-O-[3-hydroxymyristoyl] glucosamine N-acyltransferase